MLIPQLPSFFPTPAAPAGEADNSSARADLNYDSFLKLLIASMKNQDPTKPNDPSETMSQLASFSNVEQGIKLNEKLAGLLSVSSAGQAAALIGKTVSSMDGTITGIAKSVELGSGGPIVVLDSGERLSVGDGLRIS
jgi:flagellar basal-body rod modification protein FlgD